MLKISKDGRDSKENKEPQTRPILAQIFSASFKGPVAELRVLGPLGPLNLSTET